MPTTFLLIPVDGEPTMATPDTDTLDWLQAKVGGWLESIRVVDHTLLVNEDGGRRGLSRNDVATTLLQRAEAAVLVRDFIRGDAVLCGPTNDAGQFGSPDPGFLAQFLNLDG